MDDTDLLKAIYAIITMDKDGVVTSWNPDAEKILGYRRDEIVGRSGSVFFTPEVHLEVIVSEGSRETLPTRGCRGRSQW